MKYVITFALLLVLLVSGCGSRVIPGTSSGDITAVVNEPAIVQSESVVVHSVELEDDGFIHVDVTHTNNSAVDVGALDTLWGLIDSSGHYERLFVSSDPSVFMSRTLRPQESYRGSLSFAVEGQKGRYYLTFQPLRQPGLPTPSRAVWTLDL